MIPRTPTFRGEAPDDVAHESAQLTVGEMAKAAIAHHAECVANWLAAPINERPYHSDRVKAAWLDLRAYGMSAQSSAATAANGLMRAQNKLRSRK